MRKGYIVTLSGVSGCGKSYLKEIALESSLNFKSLISVTTRKKREGEIEGIDKYFLSESEFVREQQYGNICVVNNVFENLYGYKREQIDLCNIGTNLITEFFYRDVERLKKEFDNVISLYILPKNIKEAKKQLLRRNAGKEDLQKRISDFENEIGYFKNNREKFEAIFVNDYNTVSSSDFLVMMSEILLRRNNNE